MAVGGARTFDQGALGRVVASMSLRTSDTWHVGMHELQPLCLLATALGSRLAVAYHLACMDTREHGYD